MVTTTDVWQAARSELGLAPDATDVNIADLAVSRHVRAGRGEETALRWFSRDDVDADHPLDITYAMLDHRINRFAGGLRRHGLDPGSGVATLAGRVPDRRPETARCATHFCLWRIRRHG